MIAGAFAVLRGEMGDDGTGYVFVASAAVKSDLASESSVNVAAEAAGPTGFCANDLP